MGLGNFRTLSKSAYTDTVTSPMYPKKVFETVGLFDAQLTRNQDDDFNFRVLKAGGKIWFEADINLKYYVRSTFKQVRKQFFQYGYWKVYVNKKHKTMVFMSTDLKSFHISVTMFGFSISLFKQIAHSHTSF